MFKISSLIYSYEFYHGAPQPAYRARRRPSGRDRRRVLRFGAISIKLSSPGFSGTCIHLPCMGIGEVFCDTNCLITGELIKFQFEILRHQFT